MNNTAAPQFELTARVYYEDTDAGGIVYYANYLRYMERARSDWLRACGVNHQQLRSEHGVMLVVTRAYTDYLAPARLEDDIVIDVTLTRARRVSLDLNQQVRHRDGRLLCRAEVRAACVHIADQRPCRFPPSVLGAIS